MIFSLKMVHVLRFQNILVIYSKHFLHFEWKLDELDLKPGSRLESPVFNLEYEDGLNSCLAIHVEEGGEMIFYLHHTEALGNGYYVLTVLDKNNSLIQSMSGSTKPLDRIQLFEESVILPATTEYPLIVSCTAKSSVNEHFHVSDVNYKKRMSEFSTDWMIILEQGLNTDIELITDGERIKAHQIVLQAHSPVFRKMFEHESREASNNTVVISDIESATLKRLVNFLYTGFMDRGEFDEAMELYYAADKYEVLSLREDCMVELLKHLDINNACHLFTFANKHSDDELKGRVVRFVCANFTRVVCSESMHEMSKEDLIMLMRLCASVISRRNTAGIK